MSAPVLVSYLGKMDTVEALARSLIVASAVHSGPGPFNLPLTADAARHLGRSLEWAVMVSECHDASLKNLTEWHDTVVALKRAAEAEAEKAVATYERAKRAFWQAIVWNAAAMVWFMASLAFWWLA